MKYNLIIHDNEQNRSRLYGSYDSHKEANHAARMISGKIVGYNPIAGQMRVDSFVILDDIQYINTKF